MEESIEEIYQDYEYFSLGDLIAYHNRGKLHLAVIIKIEQYDGDLFDKTGVIIRGDEIDRVHRNCRFVVALDDGYECYERDISFPNRALVDLWMNE